MIFLIQIYLKTGETLQSHNNSLIVSNLMAFLHHLWTREDALPCRAVNLIFFWSPTHCRRLSGWRPAGMFLGVLIVHCKSTLTVISLPKKFSNYSGSLRLDALFSCPTNGPAFQEDNGPFYIMNDLITGLGSDLARWATQTEKYITQMLHKPTLGRGSNIKLTTAPLVDASTSRKWLRGSVAFWEKLNVRLNVVHHSGHRGVTQDILHMLQDVTQFCSEDFSADVFVALVAQWLQHPASDPGEIRAQILEQEHLAQKQALHSTSLEFHEWLKKAHHHGLRGLFRSLRQREGVAETFPGPPGFGANHCS